MSIISRTKNGTERERESPGNQIALTAQPSKVARGPQAVLSAAPRANLMPPEIGRLAAEKSSRSKMRLALLLVVVLTVGGVGGAWVTNYYAQSRLTASNDEGARLQTEQAKYAAVKRDQTDIALGLAAQKVGGSTDIDWKSYLSRLRASLPAGVTLTDVTVDSADITGAFGQATTPLEGQRIAELTFTASSPTLPSIPDWLSALSTLTGFVDATPGSVALDDTGVYNASVTMHIDSDVYSQRFVSKKEVSR